MKQTVRRVAIALITGLLLGQGAFTARADNGGGTHPFALSAPANATEALRRSYYQYDNKQPLNAELKMLDDNEGRTRYHLAYDSAHDQRVTAILAVPKRFAAPHPAILLVHGSGGNKDVDYIRAASEALTSQGYTTLSLDTQYRGERARPGKNGELQPDSFTTRDAWVQTVIDLRRAVDYLHSRPDVDKAKIGYLGFSMGGMLGAVLGGVEERIDCFFLAVPGGGIVNAVKHIDRYPMLKERFGVEITPEVMGRIEEIASVIDPIYYVGNILPRPLMIVVGKHDELIPAEMSTALVEASHAKEPENVMRLDSGHIPPLTIVFDIRNFFAAHLGKPK